MRRIRFFLAASLDGYIADPSGSVDFLDAFDEDHGYDAFIADVGTLVMGRRTYDSWIKSRLRSRVWQRRQTDYAAARRRKRYPPRERVG